MAAAITLMAMTRQDAIQEDDDRVGQAIAATFESSRECRPVLLLSVMESVVMVRSFGNSRL